MLQDFEQAMLEVQVVGDEWNKSNRADLDAFEARTGLLLPEEYKEFCQVFGDGYFRFGIISTPSEEGNNFTEYASDSMENLEMQDVEDFDPETAKHLVSLRQLFAHALEFGTNGEAMSFFWDSRTYSETDKSYDIYIASFENYRWCKFGRSFFQFIQTLFIENDFRLLPPDLRLEPEEEPRTFNIRVTVEDEDTEDRND
ncbi:MAG: SMI1/KNR4 family protein [Myxacorys chilensis ATA2-1-KO14]|jgi:hypothetical protein|nr:SMI1/KNR4 family protein [Myxacorys chilensis ATA2-1-KO14]